MHDPFEQVRLVFEKAIGPHNKRQKIMDELKEPDVGKSKRARLVEEAAEIEKQWEQALADLKKALNELTAIK